MEGLVIGELSLPVADAPLEPASILHAAIETALARVEGPLVLAVSGGRDSMAMMHAMARWAPARVAAVATFDHGTGAHATDAASLVAAEGRRLGLTVVRERARTVRTSESGWRAQRWDFLHRVGRAFAGRVATAHSRDDQVETVVMRALRLSGARGLAGLAAPSLVVRPWLPVSRNEIATWADGEGLPYLDDPGNATARHLRGRIRHDLLPAIAAIQPGFADDMLALAGQAASLRRDIEAFVDALQPTPVGNGALRLGTAALESMTDAGRALVWQALAARIGVVLDARGTRALVRFTDAQRSGAMRTLAKGAVALRLSTSSGEAFEVRRGATRERRQTTWTGPAMLMPARLAGFRFTRVPRPAVPGGVDEHAADAVAAGANAGANAGAADVFAGATDPWVFAVPAAAVLSMRLWQAGDRIRTAGARAGRRVARYFAEAHVPALDRPHWPVVLVGDAIAWVPGICRSVAESLPPERSDLLWYRCERDDGRRW